jgi:hypothetical protein
MERSGHKNYGAVSWRRRERSSRDHQQGVETKPEPHQRRQGAVSSRRSAALVLGHNWPGPTVPRHGVRGEGRPGSKRAATGVRNGRGAGAETVDDHDCRTCRRRTPDLAFLTRLHCTQPSAVPCQMTWRRPRTEEATVEAAMPSRRPRGVLSSRASSAEVGPCWFVPQRSRTSVASPNRYQWFTGAAGRWPFRSGSWDDPSQPIFRGK